MNLCYLVIRNCYVEDFYISSLVSFNTLPEIAQTYYKLSVFSEANLVDTLIGSNYLSVLMIVTWHTTPVRVLYTIYLKLLTCMILVSRYVICISAIGGPLFYFILDTWIGSDVVSVRRSEIWDNSLIRSYLPRLCGD